LVKSIYKSLKKEERLSLLFISFFTFFSIIIELFGLSLLIPISKLFLDNEFYNQLINEYGNIQLLKNLDKNEIINIIIIFFISIFVIKTIFLSILSYSKFSFINKLINSTTIELYSLYLEQNISFFNKNHSSRLIKNLVNEMNVMSAFYNALIILFSEILFTTIIIIGIIIYDALIFIYLSVYAVTLYLAFKILFKNKIYNWGVEREAFQSKIVKEITESFGAIKELIIYNKEEIFKDRIKELYSSKLKLDVRFATVNEIPKFFIELAAVIGFLLLVMILIFGGVEKSSLLVTLIFFSALLFKGLPSISRIVNSIQQIKFYYPTHTLIYSELSLLNIKKNTKKEKIEFNRIIDLKKLTFSYEGKTIFNDFSIQIKKGQRLIIFGKSGRGKSTLIDIISGFHDKINGEFLVDGKTIGNFKNWRQKIGYLPQSFFILDDTIRNNIILNDKFDQHKFDQIVNICRLKDFLDLRINGINDIIGERGSMLSGGEKQRIGLARALYSEPEILILDEPTSSLDDETANDFIDSILKLDKKLTIIMVTHDKTFSDKFDKIIRL
jgi:ATP-binding cassette, subfamily B, bacterial PglK